VALSVEAFCKSSSRAIIIIYLATNLLGLFQTTTVVETAILCSQTQDLQCPVERNSPWFTLLRILVTARPFPMPPSTFWVW
jgi:hypothetical protein